MSNEPFFQSLAFLGGGHLDLDLCLAFGLGDFRLTEIQL